MPENTFEKNGLNIRNCGTADYREILQLQSELHMKRLSDTITNTVLIVEHPDVITFGARNSINLLKVEPEALSERKIDLVETRRGGGVTAHNPGQVVFYPILRLKDLTIGATEYVRILESIGQELLKQFGIDSINKAGFPGLWVGDRKIASIGVRVSKGVTYHGMAINIQNDLSIFDLIVPCGLEEVEVTSVLKETGQQIPMDLVKEKLAELLVCHFSKNAAQARQGDRKLPGWLVRPLPSGEIYDKTEKILTLLGLDTICNSANCPNRGQCWSRGTATVLILGKVCTRNCGFCSVTSGKPQPPEPNEPADLAKMVKQLGLKYLVITSVNRDDLPDGGAAHFRDCIEEVRRQCPDTEFEILTPDFRHCQTEALDILDRARPFVFGHNVETVPSLYPIARAGGDYLLSLKLLKLAKEKWPKTPTKSSIMLGLGEIESEVEQVLSDLRRVGCNRITIGQYLKPKKDSLDVQQYVEPAEFDRWKDRATALGFDWVISEPFARSSYHAEKKIANRGFQS
ncbi:MAG: lipoyl synthase [Planctomycetota bacterium]